MDDSHLHASGCIRSVLAVSVRCWSSHISFEKFTYFDSVSYHRIYVYLYKVSYLLITAYCDNSYNHPHDYESSYQLNQTIPRTSFPEH